MRVWAALIAGEPLRIGAHELRFHAGAGFGVIPVAFEVREPEARLTVSLTLAAPRYTVGFEEL